MSSPPLPFCDDPSPLLSQWEYPMLTQTKEREDHIGNQGGEGGSFKRIFIAAAPLRPPLLPPRATSGAQPASDGGSGLDKGRNQIQTKQEKLRSVDHWEGGSFEIGFEARRIAEEVKKRQQREMRALELQQDEETGERESSSDDKVNYGTDSTDVQDDAPHHKGAIEQESRGEGQIVRSDRMLVKVEWTSREDLPSAFNDMTAGKYPTVSKRFRIFDVILRDDRIELWSLRKNPLVSLFTRSHAFPRYVIPLKRHTTFSLYSSMDLVYCLKTPVSAMAVGKASDVDEMGSKRRKRDRVRGRRGGTNLFLFRTRQSSVARSWIWQLWSTYFKSPVPTTLDISIPNLEISKMHEFHELVEGGEESLRLCFRRGRILDWIEADDQNFLLGYVLAQPHLVPQLELRRSEHYPTTVRFPSSSRQLASTFYAEPPAIEGFVRRFKAKGGTERIYLSTHDHYLFRSRPAHAHAPLPPVLKRPVLDNPGVLVLAPFAYGSIKKEHSRSRWPRLFSRTQVGHVPITLSDSVIPSSIVKFEEEEKARLQRQIMSSNGHIDLGDVESVMTDIGGEEGHDERVIVVKLQKSGRTVRFECGSKASAEEWTGRLNGLIRYWKRRRVLDLHSQMDLPAAAPHVPTAFSPYLGLTFNRCIVETCRTITKSGRLYSKIGARGAYCDRELILLGDLLIEYEPHPRDIRNQLLPTIYRKQIRIIDVKDQFLVSGIFCSNYFPAADEMQPRRIYDDGLQSEDEMNDCVFALICVTTKRVTVFRARSMAERNGWIWAINLTKDRERNNETRR